MNYSSLVRSLQGSIFSYNSNMSSKDNKGYGGVPGYASFKLEGYYDLPWSSRAAVVVGSGL